MNETDFRNDLTKKLTGPGGGALVFKIHGHAMQKSGWPDLQIYSPHLPNCCLHAELKVRNRKADTLQRDKIAELRRRGVFAYVVRLVEDDLHFEDQNGDVEFVIEHWQSATGIELMRLIDQTTQPDPTITGLLDALRAATPLINQTTQPEPWRTAVQDKRSMTLNLTSSEMEALGKLAQRKDLSKTAIIRQALRLYQLVETRVAQGEKLVFEDELQNKKSVLMMLG